MSLQERTLVVRNFDPDRTTAKLLKELCLQGGPVRKVIMRSDHAFVEYEDVDSVGYSKALLDGIKMFDRILSFEPKLRLNIYSKYTRALNDYIRYDKDQRAEQQKQQLLLQQQQQMQYYPQYMTQMQASTQPPTPDTTQQFLAPYQLQIQNQLGYQLPPGHPQYFPPVQFRPQPPPPSQQSGYRGQFSKRRR